MDHISLSDLEQQLIEASNGIALLGQLILLSIQNDFSLIQGNESVRLDEERKDIKHITHPESFRETLIQLKDVIFQSFLAVHSDMNTLKLFADNIVQHILALAECINNAEHLYTALPVCLKTMLAAVDNCVGWSYEVGEGFQNVFCLLEELISSCNAVHRMKKGRVTEICKFQTELDGKRKKYREDKMKDKLQNTFLESITEQIYVSIPKMETDLLEKLELAIKILSQLEKHLKTFSEFVEKVAKILKVEMNKSINNCSQGMNQVMKRELKCAKNILIKLTLRAYSQCCMVCSVLTSFITISDKYLMSSVVDLGTLLSLDSKNDCKQMMEKSGEIELRCYDTFLCIEKIIASAKQENKNKLDAFNHKYNSNTQRHVCDKSQLPSLLNTIYTISTYLALEIRNLSFGKFGVTKVENEQTLLVQNLITELEECLSNAVRFLDEVNRRDKQFKTDKVVENVRIKQKLTQVTELYDIASVMRNESKICLVRKPLISYLEEFDSRVRKLDLPGYQPPPRIHSAK